jgi:hypothetical protein
VHHEGGAGEEAMPIPRRAIDRSQDRLPAPSPGGDGGLHRTQLRKQKKQQISLSFLYLVCGKRCG